ncbi:SET domain-containing protein-lysine N-methyltransferase [Pseudomonas sp. Irchel s3a18]|uniref:SET domain-containing protein-lysine N-methyltransferase n=1 Tax=Pseudomonas sp. Irchel s3a18 TaxID=2009053 RepID=UPI000BA37FC3|nr:SET domain-containing protein-lysine N-methyltransferase [Pseudomonas sp. Irchel s3a18]
MKPLRSNVCIYPYDELSIEEDYPSTESFKVVCTEDGRGEGIESLKTYLRGQQVCRVSGYMLASRRLHTLQINYNTHLYDPYFTGLLLHSCDPNVFLDMNELELWALKTIRPGELLCMDYSSTEDILMRQFACQCGSPNCRRWITGSKELPNEEGQRFLQQCCDTAVKCIPNTDLRGDKS